MILDTLDMLKNIAILLLVIFIFIFVAVFALKIGIKAVKGENTKFGEVFITGLVMIFLMSIITGAFQLILPAFAFIGSIIALLIGMFIIKSRHKTTLLGGFAAIIIYAVMIVVLYILLIFVFTSVNAIITGLINFDLSDLIPEF